MIRLEKRVIEPGKKKDKVLKYQAVETDSKQLTISSFIERFGAPKDLESALDKNSTWRHGNATFILSDENGPLIPEVVNESQG